MRPCLLLILLLLPGPNGQSLPGSGAPEPIPALPSPATVEIVLETLTVYNPVPGQTDSTPLLTACGKKINLKKLRQKQLSWMAVSRDLLAKNGGTLHYGDTVTLVTAENSSLGEWIIVDTMNKRFTAHGDLLYHPDVRRTGKWHQVRLRKKCRTAA